jgi:hypothetical protein
MQSNRLGWDPRSRTILFLKERDGKRYLWQFDPDNSTECPYAKTPLSDDTTSVILRSGTSSWSPDGRFFLYLVAHTQSSSPEPKPLSSEALTGVDADVNWIFSNEIPNAERDSQEVRQGTGKDRPLIQPQELWLLDTKGDTRRRLSDSGSDVTDPLWELYS